MISWYYDTDMKLIATNIRFPEDEYLIIKKLAFAGKRSISSLVRDAVRQYKENKLANSKDRKALFDTIVKMGVKIDIPVTKLVQEGRRFE